MCTGLVGRVITPPWLEVLGAPIWHRIAALASVAAVFLAMGAATVVAAVKFVSGARWARGVLVLTLLPSANRYVREVSSGRAAFGPKSA